MQCSAGKTWVLEFKWMPLDTHTHTTYQNIVPDQVHPPCQQHSQLTVSPLSRTMGTANSQPAQERPEKRDKELTMSTWLPHLQDPNLIEHPWDSLELVQRTAAPWGRGGVHVLQWCSSGACVSSGFHMNAWNMFPSGTMPVTRLSMLFTSPVSSFILWLIIVDSHDKDGRSNSQKTKLE